jgi:hypothetical protein
MAQANLANPVAGTRVRRSDVKDNEEEDEDEDEDVDKGKGKGGGKGEGQDTEESEDEAASQAGDKEEENSNKGDIETDGEEEGQVQDESQVKGDVADGDMDEDQSQDESRALGDVADEDMDTGGSFLGSDNASGSFSLSFGTNDLLDGTPDPKASGVAATAVAGAGSSQPSHGLFSGSSKAPLGLFSGSSKAPQGLFSGSSKAPQGLFSGSSKASQGIFSGFNQPSQDRFVLEKSAMAPDGHTQLVQPLLNSAGTSTAPPGHSNIYDHSDVYAPEDINMDEIDTHPAKLFGASRTIGGTIRGNAQVNNMADLTQDSVVPTAVKGDVKLYLDDRNPAQIHLESADFRPTAFISTRSYRLAEVLQELNKVYTVVTSDLSYTFFVHQEGLWCPKGTYQHIITSGENDDDDDDWKDLWAVTGHKRVIHILMVCMLFI